MFGMIRDYDTLKKCLEMIHEKEGNYSDDEISGALSVIFSYCKADVEMNEINMYEVDGDFLQFLGLKKVGYKCSPNTEYYEAHDNKRNLLQFRVRFGKVTQVRDPMGRMTTYSKSYPLRVLDLINYINIAKGKEKEMYAAVRNYVKTKTLQPTNSDQDTQEGAGVPA